QLSVCGARHHLTRRHHEQAWSWGRAPGERGARGGAGGGRGGGGAVGTARRHDVAGALAIAEVVERVAIEHDEVGELAPFDRAEILVEPEIPRAVEGRAAQRLERTH